MSSNDLKDDLADKASEMVMGMYLSEFPVEGQELADEVRRRAAELLYQPIHHYDFANVEALADWAMVELRFTYSPATMRLTKRQLDNLRRDAWRTLEAAQIISTTSTTRESTNE